MSARTSAPTRLVLCPTVTITRSFQNLSIRRTSVRFEVHRHPVDAIAQMRRRRAVLEDVTEMAAAAAAMHLVAHHAVAGVGRFFDRPGFRVVEARPAGAALEFLFRREQRLAAAGAGK